MIADSRPNPRMIYNRFGSTRGNLLTRYFKILCEMTPETDLLSVSDDNFSIKRKGHVSSYLKSSLVLRHLYNIEYILLDTYTLMFVAGHRKLT